MKRTYLTAATVLAAIFATGAYADGSEAIAIISGSENGDRFYMGSVRQDLDQVEGGLRLRFDVINGTYPTDYDATSGEGTYGEYRLLLSYTHSLSASADLTLSGGVNQWTLEVRPDTLSSPADESETGLFASVEYFNSDVMGNDLLLIGEYNSVGPEYLAASYLFDLNTFSVGPSVDYVLDDDYKRVSFGIAAVVSVSDAVEFRATVTNGRETIGSAPAIDAVSMQLQAMTSW
jgi:hypothetical protein